MNSLINRAAVKRLALDKVKERAWKPTRFAESFFERIEAKVRILVIHEVKAHPSKGKTIT